MPCSDVVVLLIDNDEMFRDALGELLRDDGHPVLAAASIEDVPPLDRLSEVKLIITDYQRRRPTALALADALRRNGLMIPVMLVTTFPTALVEAEVARREYVHLVHKPVDYDELHRLVHRLVGGADPGVSRTGHGPRRSEPGGAGSAGADCDLVDAETPCLPPRPTAKGLSR